MTSPVVQKGIEMLTGEGEDVFQLMAAGCETALQWEKVLEVPLERACIRGNTRLATKLVIAGARVGHVSFKNAAAFNRWDTLLELLSLTLQTRMESVVMIKDGWLKQTLCITAGKGQTVVTRALLEAGAGHHLDRALILAVKDAGATAEEIVRDLLDQPGAARVINWFDTDRENPLLLASRRGLHRICSMLLDKGAEVNAQASAGQPTPLYSAVLSGNLETVLVLLRAGADSKAPCSIHGRNVVHTACQYGDCREKILRALINHGADVSMPDERQVTPIHLAVGVSPTCAHTLRMLVDAGADLNARKADGSTPLHSAARYLKVDAVRALLWYGADETLTTAPNCTTPLDVVGMRVEGHAPLATDCERVRDLLIGAPAERAWKRRSCIVLCRAHCTSIVATSMAHQVRCSQRVCSRRPVENDGFGDIVRRASDDVFRKIVSYL